MFSANNGKLPSASGGSVAGIALPPGRIVHTAKGDGIPVAWISTVPLPAEDLNVLIRKLGTAFVDTGLWPVRAEGLHDGQLDRPWGDGELEGPRGEIPDALTVLQRNDDALSLAPGTHNPELSAELIVVDPGALMLVPVGRPADVVAALGWWGATNHDLSGADISSVLRSWEDRFGAVLVSIGFDTMAVQVPRRPDSTSELDGLLREHYSFCPDIIDQGLEAEAYRAGLAEWTHWHFWWD